MEAKGGGAEDRDLRNKGSNHGKACPSLEGRKRVQSSEGLAEHFHEGRCEPAQRTSIGAVCQGPRDAVVTEEGRIGREA